MPSPLELRMPAATLSPSRTAIAPAWPLLLLAIDGLFILLHLMRVSGAVTSDLFYLHIDGGYAEWWQYAKEAATAAALVQVFRASRQPVYLAWAAVFAYALLDDALMLHEWGGAAAAGWLGLPALAGLRPGDLGELLVSAAAGLPLLAASALAHAASNGIARKHSMCLLGCFALLAFFGVLVDMLHIAIVSAGWAVRGINMFEDGGELVAMSLAAAFSLRLASQPLLSSATNTSCGASCRL
jgi:hypothetical protein